MTLRRAPPPPLLRAVFCSDFGPLSAGNKGLLSTTENELSNKCSACMQVAGSSRASACTCQTSISGANACIDSEMQFSSVCSAAQCSDAHILSVTEDPYIHKRTDTDAISCGSAGRIEQVCVEPSAKRSRGSGCSPKSKGRHCMEAYSDFGARFL